MLRSSPAAQRNKGPICEFLKEALTDTGKVLEIASGSGEHALYFAEQMPQTLWQPSDPSPEALDSIDGWRVDADLPNLLAPLQIDASIPEQWPDIPEVTAVLCINMVHISPWAATQGLMRGAARLLQANEPLILYGPYIRDGVETAPSNLAFDADLKRRNAEWGVRNLADVTSIATENGFAQEKIVEMPANNITVIYRKLQA